MRYAYSILLLVTVSAVALLTVCAPSGPAARGEEDVPGIIICFSGDLEGYLEECG